MSEFDAGNVEENANTATFNLSSTSPASASTAVGATVTGLGAFRSLDVFATLTGATGGVLDVYLQTSPDGGTTWVDYAHYVQIAAADGAANKRFLVTNGGQQTTVTTVGTGTTPALAANTVLGGDFGDRMRVVYVAGASTSAGAAQTILLFAKS
jgi:hypothetical protein